MIEENNLNRRKQLNINQKKYREKYLISKFIKYIKVIICPKCNKKGYKKYYGTYDKRINKLTNIRTLIFHQHMIYINGIHKNIHDGCCYIGMGEL